MYIESKIDFITEYSKYAVPALNTGSLICLNETCRYCLADDICRKYRRFNQPLTEKDLPELKELLPELFI